jgi:hypothetical protein
MDAAIIADDFEAESSRACVRQGGNFVREADLEGEDRNPILVALVALLAVLLFIGFLVLVYQASSYVTQIAVPLDEGG